MNAATVGNLQLVKNTYTCCKPHKWRF